MTEKIFSLPSIEVKKITKSPLVTKFIIQHLTPRLAIALGNTFRQLLITQVPGWGIFAVKFADKNKTIPTEWDILQGSKVLPSEIIFHLQELVFKDKGDLDKNQIHTLKINVDNSHGEQAYQVTGKDIQGELEIINPEVYLTTLEIGAQLKIELYCRYNWDSVSAKEQKSLLKEKERENVIFLPTDYCPVKTVSLKTADVGSSKKEEPLELVITTDGSISGSDSMLVIGKFLEQIVLEIQQKITSVEQN
jgi:DNA-directed RNA polymerase alpha subunit